MIKKTIFHKIITIKAMLQMNLFQAISVMIRQTIPFNKKHGKSIAVNHLCSQITFTSQMT